MKRQKRFTFERFSKSEIAEAGAPGGWAFSVYLDGEEFTILFFRYELSILWGAK